MTEAQWLACRAHGPKGDIPYTVGGSDVAAIFGLSPWTTPSELWLIKKGRMKSPVKNNEEQLEMGHLLEPIAARWFEKKTGNLVTNDTSLYQLLSILKELCAAGMEKVMTAFDMDYLVNPHVRAGQENLAHLLDQCGISYGTYLWNPRYKGLDDYIWGCLCGPK